MSALPVEAYQAAAARHRVSTTRPDIEYFRCAKVKPEEMVYLLQAGVDGHDAYWFKESGVMEPAEMARLKGLGLHGSTADCFTEAGVDEPEDMIRLYDAGVVDWQVMALGVTGLRGVEQILAFFAASKLNGIQPEELEYLYEDLEKLGRIGARIKALHIAPKTTGDVLRKHNHLIPMLEELDDSALKCVVMFAEDQDHVTAEEFQTLIAAARQLLDGGTAQ